MQNTPICIADIFTYRPGERFWLTLLKGLYQRGRWDRVGGISKSTEFIPVLLLQEIVGLYDTLWVTGQIRLRLGQHVEGPQWKIDTSPATDHGAIFDLHFQVLMLSHLIEPMARSPAPIDFVPGMDPLFVRALRESLDHLKNEGFVSQQNQDDLERYGPVKQYGKWAYKSDATWTVARDLQHAVLAPTAFQALEATEDARFLLCQQGILPFVDYTGTSVKAGEVPQQQFEKTIFAEIMRHDFSL